MKNVLLVSILFILVFCNSLLNAELVTEQEFIIEGTPTTSTPVVTTSDTTVITTTPAVTQTAPTVVATPGTVVLLPGEKDVYIGMSRHHAVQKLGPPTYVEKFRRYTRRHHGIYDEVLTYASPAGNLVLYIKERRVQKIGHE